MSDIDYSLAERHAALGRTMKRIEEAGIAHSGGGGDGTGMEARVNRIEERLDKAVDRLTAVEVTLATLTERIAHLPSKGFIVTTVTTGIGAVMAVVLLADKLKALLGLMH